MQLRQEESGPDTSNSTVQFAIPASVQKPARGRRRPASRSGFTLVEVMVATVLLSMIIVGILSALIGAYRVSAKARVADHARYVIKSLSEQFLTQATADTSGTVYTMFQLTLNPNTGNQQPMGTGITWTNSDGSHELLSSDQSYCTVKLDDTTGTPINANVTRSVWYLYDTDGSETLLNQNKSGGYMIEGTFTISYSIFNVQVPPISLTNIRAFP